MADLNKHSIEMERLSAISSIHRNPKDSTYANHNTPAKYAKPDMENGALREGKPLKIMSIECIGLLAQYAGVGFLAGIIPGVIYPVLQGYLNAEGTTVTSATVLVQIPWCYKMFFGVISDCFPILGYRRRPYMVIGWLFCITILFVMAAMSIPDPYYGDAAMHTIDEEDWTDDQIDSINESAPNSAGKYVVPMMLASFGYLLCEVAADAMVVEYAQREPLEQRGRVQTAVYVVKTSFTAIGATVIAFFMNGEEYAGSFSFSLSFQELMMITGVICAPLVLISWFLLNEELWDVVRNQWFWLGVPMIEYLPDGIRFMIATYVVVELAEPGHEGALYGLLTATTNLTTPFGRSMAKLVNAQFHVWLKDIQADTTLVRRDVTITIWICYSMKLLSLAFLPLLPRQKAETQELKRTGGSSRTMGIITVGYLAFAIVWATLVNLLSMYETTMCWKITGGCAPKS
uniref:Uncharacterized protein n=1 Tax=Phytophthora ramorum TaxID=164328 RepID=H3GS27_PHYRM